VKKLAKFWSSALKGCQTIDKVDRFCLPIKSANKILQSFM